MKDDNVPLTNVGMKSNPRKKKMNSDPVIGLRRLCGSITRHQGGVESASDQSKNETKMETKENKRETQHRSSRSVLIFRSAVPPMGRPKRKRPVHRSAPQREREREAFVFCFCRCCCCWPLRLSDRVVNRRR